MTSITNSLFGLTILKWLLGVLWLVVLILHVWLHMTLSRTMLAGGSDSGMATSKIDVITSSIFVVACLGMWVLAFFRLSKRRTVALILYSLLTALSLVSGRVVAIGGVRGDLAIAEGWFMIPVRIVDLSMNGVDNDVRTSQWRVHTQGSSQIILTASQERHVIWTGPFIHASTMDMLSNLL
jgi:hypothetical protein